MKGTPRPRHQSAGSPAFSQGGAPWGRRGFVRLTLIACAALLAIVLAFVASHRQDPYLAQTRKWAAAGQASAQFNLGSRYARGDGVRKNVDKALKWYRLAAAQGDSGAELNLGALYEAGEGVPKDVVTARKWYLLAADQGLDGAQYNLGRVYSLGLGVPRDNVEAYKWYSLAAASGFTEAAEARKLVEAKMSTEQVAEAHKLAQEWRPKK